MLKINSKKSIRIWLLCVFIFTFVAGLIYLVVQQNYRLSANDPQIQMSEDFAHKLSMNPTSDLATPAEQLVDVSQSLAPFVVIYDDRGKVLSSGGVLDGQTPILPSGVFDYTKSHTQDRFTWQPKPGVRLAAVLTSYNGNSSGFVLAARSLREVEMREELLNEQVVFWWVASLIGSLFFALLANLEMI